VRRVIRASLPDEIQEQLRHKQRETDRKRAEGVLRVNNEWKNARQTNLLLSVLAVLKNMMGKRARCMYCLDSHGSDIEHFWPKTPYPERMFLWPNLLLCCTECGRLKLDDFPLSEGQPLLIDPTTEEPWLYLDFDPGTGNVVARFELDSNDWSPKGLKTVEILHLDGREALAAGYQKTFRRLSGVVERFLTDGAPAPDGLLVALWEVDDHGLLGWCFMGTGRSMPPFRELSEQQPEVWATCRAAIQQQ
jgi:uncharacterized protein (TIGR02646 family)